MNNKQKIVEHHKIFAIDNGKFYCAYDKIVNERFHNVES